MKDYIVSINSGKVKGYERDGFIEYLGMPYAKPPVGKLRFKRSIPVDPWDGVFDAKEYGDVSVQFDEGKLIGSEDCLTINVQRPAGEGENLPVLVWIHGGGYNTGSASCPLTDGRCFAENGIVFVSLQYRLNVLGFYDFTTYPGCEDFDSNCGLSDQILALKWVHDNIAAFGGDPENVTIMGESAGGASVVNMLACPSVKGYFRKAIAQSGLPNCVMTHETARENISIFLEAMGWTEENMAEHLMNDDPFEFQKGNTAVAEKHQYRNPGMFLPGPIQDDLLPVRPIDAVRNGSAEGVKLIIGSNMHEGTMFVHPEKTGFPNSWAMVAEMFEKNGHSPEIPEIISYYQPSAKDKFSKFKAGEEFSCDAIPDLKEEYRTEGGDPFIAFATDYAFQMPALKIADAQKNFGDVWMYRFEFVSKSGEETGWKASHAFDLPCMFANTDFGFSHFLFDGEPEEVVNYMIDSMHRPWVNFVLTDEPDPENWPRFTGYDSPVRIFDRVTHTEQLDRTDLMNVWKDMRFYED